MRTILGLTLACALSTLGWAADDSPPSDPKTAPASPAAEKPQGEELRYMRVVRNEADQPTALQTAIVRFKPKDKTESDHYVDLIGAVHIGDKEYYERLNKEFADYDALLYELVAPKGTRIPKGARGGSGSPVSALQIMLKDALALEFQLEQIDYEAKNFVHADLSPDEFARSMKNLNESPIQMFLQLMKASMVQARNRKRPPPSDFVILAALLKGREGAPVLKQIFADELSEADVVLEALNGPNGSTLVTERNKVALQVMKEQLEAGKKKLGIFYGAAHMNDIAERLAKEHGMVPVETRWVTAWDLTKSASPAPPRRPVRLAPQAKPAPDAAPAPADKPAPATSA
jgi:hypothetical protein